MRIRIVSSKGNHSLGLRWFLPRKKFRNYLCQTIFEIPQCRTKLSAGDVDVSLRSKHKFHMYSVTLTVKLVSWLLQVKHRLVMIIVFAK